MLRAVAPAKAATRFAIGTVLSITASTVVTIIFVNTFLALLAIIAMSVVIGFVGAIGTVAVLKKHVVMVWHVPAAEAKAQHAQEILHWTVVKDNRGNHNGTSEISLEGVVRLPSRAIGEIES